MKRKSGIQRTATAKPQQRTVSRPPSQGTDDGIGNLAIQRSIKAAIAAERGGGEPLPTSMLSTMPELGSDLRDVRLHMDERASELTAKLGANAFTVGDDVFVDPAACHPQSPAGMRVIAHELVHVAQEQRGGSVDIDAVEPVGSAAEREADAMAGEMMAGRSPRNPSESPRGIPRDVGFARRGEIPDPYGEGYNTILANAGPEAKGAIMALASLETPRMFVDIEKWKAMDDLTRKAVLGLEQYAKDTACAAWFDVLRANDPNRPPPTAEEISAGERAYYESTREVRLKSTFERIEAVRAEIPTLSAVEIDARWKTDNYAMVTAASTPNHHIPAMQLHQIWLHYWEDRYARAREARQAIIDRAFDADAGAYMDKMTRYHDGDRDAMGPGFADFDADYETGDIMFRNSVDALEFCRAAEANGTSLTLDDLTRHMIEWDRSVGAYRRAIGDAMMFRDSPRPTRHPEGPRPSEEITPPTSKAPEAKPPAAKPPVASEVKAPEVKTPKVKAPKNKGPRGKTSTPKAPTKQPDDAPPENAPPASTKTPKRGYTGEWPPPEPGPRPKNASPEDMSKWRYKRYLRDQYNAGKQPEEILTPEGYEPYAKAADTPGARPGRGGGAAQKQTRSGPAQDEGFENTETTQLGTRTNPRTGKPQANMVDNVRPNANGGTDYLEVDDINKNGLPRAEMRAKLKEEIKAMKPGDTLEYWDKNDPSRRIQYKAGEDPSVVDTRKATTLPRGTPRK